MIEVIESFVIMVERGEVVRNYGKGFAENL